ncbi:leucine-rich repeat-containing protein 15-like [Centruroides vittatus]|uniref:leucine-rich repeat-containing protein 15-like n=1 Tax=Centruroides vittatus TaxID=120091 RepID=UPI00350EA88B
MRLLIIFPYLCVIVVCCQDFWKQWRKSSCVSSADTCYKSNKFSSVEIYDELLSVKCYRETIDYRLLRCLDVKTAKRVHFTDCYMPEFEVGRFASGHAIVRVVINTGDYEILSFTNMSSLKSVEIGGIRTGGLLRLNFRNVPSLISLKIENYNFTSLSPKSFQKLTNLSELYITWGPLKSLHEELFYGLRNLQKLDLNANGFQSVPSSIFRNLTRLEYLNLNRNKVKYLPSDLLRDLSKLRTFSIESNSELNRIPAQLLKGLRKLEKFYACGCSFSSIDEGLFSEARNLTKVCFDENQIAHLPSKLFRNNKNLEYIYFTNNEISTLPRGIFHGLSRLLTIRLDKNRLKNLPEDIFSGLTSLQYVDLSRNSIAFISENTFRPLNHLKYLDLSHNRFSKISFEISQSLDHLKMKNASLTEWPAINWTRHELTHVDLSDNDFETVKLPIYTPNYMGFRLSNCNIKTIYLDHWIYGLNMPFYDLEGNHLVCDYELQPFLYTLKSNLEISLEIFPNIKDLNCYGEDKKVLDDKAFYPLRRHCPVNCECFEDENVVKVNCAKKELENVPEFLIDNAAIVDLSYNFITEISRIDCDTWRNVIHLDLSHNSLELFTGFVMPPSLNFLSLRGNYLSELPETVTKLMDASSQFKISLSGNNWNCDCDSLFTKDWLVRNRQKIMDFSDVFCVRDSHNSSFSKIISSDYCNETSRKTTMAPEEDISF